MEGALGAPVLTTLLLARTAQVAVGLTNLLALPTGFSFRLVAFARTVVAELSAGGSTAADIRRGIVWLSEDEDDRDWGVFTGRISGYWDTGGDAPAEELADGSVDEAITWGRARAPVVLIRLGDDGFYYSAGERNPQPSEYPPWPTGGIRVERRRLRTHEFPDDTEYDPPILWDVRLSLSLEGADQRRFRAAVLADPRALEAPADKLRPLPDESGYWFGRAAGSRPRRR